MEDVEELVKNLFLKDEYVTKTASLHEEESEWKIGKIVPLVDKFVHQIKKRELSILDVGGGAGLILSAISARIESNHGIKVNKYALDLSPHMLEIQRKRNPDIVKTLNEDIRKTSLGNKEIDLILLIDVLEHIPNPTEALKELKRISRFSILKVPLEDCLVLAVWNYLNMGRPRKYDRKTYGHINIYNFKRLKHEIETHAGKLLNCHFSPTIKSGRDTERSIKPASWLKDIIALPVYYCSPRLCSMIFGTSAFVLVKCYQDHEN
ncbi:MAG: hypothetical protein A2144_05185 [Chloroflexi bacterium RBG_16_50_9]|nr:MAG: hypothetical protein A2144_05185 [Chloroflexi bacterium RBG_16_50_9]